MFQKFTPPLIDIGTFVAAVPNVVFAVYKDAVGEAVSVEAVHAAQG